MHCTFAPTEVPFTQRWPSPRGALHPQRWPLPRGDLHLEVTFTYRGDLRLQRWPLPRGDLHLEVPFTHRGALHLEVPFTHRGHLCLEVIFIHWEAFHPEVPFTQRPFTQRWYKGSQEVSWFFRSCVWTDFRLEREAWQYSSGLNIGPSLTRSDSNASGASLNHFATSHPIPLPTPGTGNKAWGS